MILWDCILEGMETEYWLKMSNVFLIHFEHTFACYLVETALFSRYYFYLPYLLHEKKHFATNMYLFKVSNRNSRKTMKYAQS